MAKSRTTDSHTRDKIFRAATQVFEEKGYSGARMQEIADKAGITAVIQPGGSINDKLSVDYCNEHGLAMVKTGIRHFKH